MVVHDDRQMKKKSKVLYVQKKHCYKNKNLNNYIYIYIYIYIAK
jgi:hypothetical protein